MPEPQLNPAEGVLCAEPEVDYLVLDRIIRDEYGANKENLIMIMQTIQRHFHFLPEAALRYLAQTIGVPLTRIYEVATFYASFSLIPKGKHIIQVCTGTACHLKGSHGMVHHLSEKLNIDPGTTTPDMEFTLETVNCVGACAVAPVVVVDEKYHPKADIGLVNEMLARIKAE